jgi:hypothetical protein
MATLPANLPPILFAPSVPPISAQAMLSVMREAAKTVRAIGHCACERRENARFSGRSARLPMFPHRLHRLRCEYEKVY